MLNLIETMTTLSMAATVGGIVPEVDISYHHNLDPFVSNFRFRFTWRLRKQTSDNPTSHFLYNFERQLTLADLSRIYELEINIEEIIGFDAFINFQRFLKKRKPNDE